MFLAHIFARNNAISAFFVSYLLLTMQWKGSIPHCQELHSIGKEGGRVGTSIEFELSFALERFVLRANVSSPPSVIRMEWALSSMGPGSMKSSLPPGRQRASGQSSGEWGSPCFGSCNMWWNCFCLYTSGSWTLIYIELYSGDVHESFNQCCDVL